MKSKFLLKSNKKDEKMFPSAFALKNRILEKLSVEDKIPLVPNTQPGKKRKCWRWGKVLLLPLPQQNPFSLYLSSEMSSLMPALCCALSWLWGEGRMRAEKLSPSLVYFVFSFVYSFGNSKATEKLECAQPPSITVVLPMMDVLHGHILPKIRARTCWLPWIPLMILFSYFLSSIFFCILGWFNK